MTMNTPHHNSSSHRAAFLRFGALLAFSLLLATAAGADWLITLEGRLIETKGTWEVNGERLSYTDSQGARQSLALADIDLEASEETTAFKAGRAYIPKAKPVVADQAAADEADAEPQIILYRTEWCGYCRKAEKLLKSLDADFVIKDIERDPQAAAEFRVKGNGRGGVPLIDFDGDIVRGYSDRKIRQKTKEVEAKKGNGSS